MSTDINSDCETYDALEDQLESKPTGLFSKILPEPLYRLFFGPRPPDSDLVASRREQVSQTYQRLVSTHRSICEDLSVSIEGRPTDPSSNGLIMDFEHLSLDSSPFEIANATDKELQTHLRTLETKADQVEKLRADIESLLEGDDRVYLRADEQNQLELARQTLRAYLRKLTIRRNQIRTAHFIHKIEELKTRLETLETRMEPYLSYEKYELERGLNGALTRIQEQLAAAERDIDTSLLSDDQITELERIRQRIQELSDHLQGYQREYVDRLFPERVGDLEDELLDLQHALTPAKAQGQPIDREAELRNQIAEIRREIALRRTGRHGPGTSRPGCWWTRRCLQSGNDCGC